MKSKIIIMSCMLTILSIVILFTSFIKNNNIISYKNIEPNFYEVIVDGEVNYHYHLPIPKGTTYYESIKYFGLTSNSDLEHLYIKKSRSWHAILNPHIPIQDNVRLKVDKK